VPTAILSQIFQLDPTSDARWKAFVERHPRSSIFHSDGWLHALQTTYDYQPVAFTTTLADQPLTSALVFCRIRSWLTGSRLVSLPFSDHCEPLCDSAADLGNILQFLQGELHRQDYKYLQMRPLCSDLATPSLKSTWLPAEEYFFHLLDLTPSLNELYEAFDKDSIRRRIRRAERAGLVERRGSGGALLKDFYTLFLMTRRRHKVPPAPFRWFHNLAQALGEALEVRVAYKENMPVASIITLRFKNTIYYKYGCSDAKFNALGAIPWLFWQAIQTGKLNGATQFDFGRTELDNAGLLIFKNHWVGHPRRFVYWQYPPSPLQSLVKGWKGRLAKSAFSILPARLQTIGGNLLYRHIG
jgi:hypothetical protein